MKIIYSAVLVVFLTLSTSLILAGSSLRIQVNGILNNAAILTINGKQQMLKKNAKSEEGYQLIKIGEDNVTLLINEENVTIKLGAAITSSSSRGKAKQVVRISRDNNGMYLTSGTINGYPVNFLVDTGATFIAINSVLAKSIGIDYRSEGKPSQANTASGLVTAWKIKLDNVAIGGLHLSFVEAAVIEGNFPIKPLLGMSFLSRVKMQDDGLLLIIEEKF